MAEDLAESPAVDSVASPHGDGVGLEAVGGVGAAGAAGAGQGEEKGVGALLLLKGRDSLTEPEAKEIFNRYDQRKQGTWDNKDLRMFLFDLQSAFDSPCVVPDPAVSDVLAKLQLNMDGDAGVTWLEFKSYTLYLAQNPLEELQTAVAAHAPSSQQLEQATVLVNKLPPTVTSGQLHEIFASCGSVERVLLVLERVPEALVVFDGPVTADTVDRALDMDGAEAQGITLSVQLFGLGQYFPKREYLRQPSKVAKGLASVYVGAKAFDDKHNITNTVAKGKQAVVQKLGNFAREHKLQEKASAVGESVAQAGKKMDERLGISSGAAKVDEKLKISEKAQQASVVVRSAAGKAMRTKTVQNAISFIGGLASAVSSKVQVLANDTTVAIEEKQAARPTPPPKPAAPAAPAAPQDSEEGQRL